METGFGVISLYAGEFHIIGRRGISLCGLIDGVFE